MPKLEKEMMVNELKQFLEANDTVLATGYSGIASNDMNELRQALREKGGRLLIVKNRLARIVVREAPWVPLAGHIEGPTAFVMTSDDAVPVAKVLTEFNKGHKQFQLRGGLVQSVVVGEAQISELARLPGREQLLAQLFGGFISPVVGFVNVLSGPLGAFVRTLGAIGKKQDSEFSTQDSAKKEEQDSSEKQDSGFSTQDSAKEN